MATTYPNWFDVTAREPFERHLLPLAGKPGLRFLQIGCFTGDASVWLLDNVLTDAASVLHDVDTWSGSAETAHESMDWADVEDLHHQRTGSRRCVKFKGRSSAFFQNRDVLAPDLYDFVYVDADHTPYGALHDGIGAYEALKVGGLVAFDDLQWFDPTTGLGPFHAVQAFDFCYRGRLELIEADTQAWFRKVA